MINCVLKIPFRRSVCLLLSAFCFVSTFFDVRAENTIIDGTHELGIVPRGVTIVEGDLVLKELNMYYPGDLIVKGNVLVEGCDIVFGGNLTFYGDVVIREGASLKKDDGGLFCTCFLGGKNVKYDVCEGGLVMRNVMVSKSAGAVLEIAEQSRMMFNGRFDAWGGRIKGKVQNTGNQKIIDKLNVRGDVMRDVILVLGKKSNFLGPDVVLETDVWVKRVDADHLLAVYLGSNKLRLEEPVINGEYVSWGRSTGFITNGTAADGGVEMPIDKGNVLSVGFYQLAPPNKDELWHETIDGKNVYEYRFPLEGNKLPNYIHTPLTVNYVNKGEYVRVAPNSSLHGGLVSDMIFSVGDIYWRIETTDVRDVKEGLYTMEFDLKYYTKPIVDYKKVFFNDLKWNELGEYGGEKEILFEPKEDGSSTSGDYAFADGKYVKEYRYLVSTKSGKWGDAIWAEVDTKGNVIRGGIKGEEIVQTDNLTIKEGHIIETDNIFKEHMPSVLKIDRDKSDNKKYATFVFHSEHLNNALRTQKMYVGGNGEFECHLSATGLTGKMSMIDFTRFVINEGSHLTIVNEGGIVSTAKNAKSLIWPSVYRLPDVTFKGKKVVLRDVGNGFFGGDVRVEEGEIEFVLTCRSYMELKGNLSVDNRSTISFTGDESVCCVGGDIDVEGKLIAKGVVLNFNGEVAQCIKGSIAVDEIWVNNGRGVRFDKDIEVKRLALHNGVVDMGDRLMRVEESIVGGSEWSYIDGTLVRKLGADECAIYPVGNNCRYGQACIRADKGGEIAVTFCNEKHEIMPKGEYEIGDGYWKIGGANSIGIQLDYDENSGGVSATSDIVTLEEGEWTVLETAVVWSNGREGAMYAESEDGEVVKCFAFGIRDGLCIWKGRVDDDWEKPENWKGGIVPDSQVDAVISGEGVGYMPVISCNASVRELFIEEGARLVLAGNNGRLFVEGDIENKGEWDLYYRCTDLPTLCVKGEIRGNDARIIRSFLRGRLYYTGSATEDGKVWNVDRLNEDGGDIMHRFISESRTFVDVKKGRDEVRGDAGIFEGATIVDMVGSIALNKDRELDNNVVVQYGKPKSMVGQKTKELAEGWHWLCNPYPFAVDMRTFVTVAQGAIAPTIYARGYDCGYHFFSYNTEVGVGASGNEDEEIDTIGPFEAFAVYVEEEGTIVEVNPEYSLKGQAKLKSGAINENIELLRLTIGSDKKTDELVMIFDQAGSEVSIVDDSYKYASQPRASYQIYTEKEGQRLVISVLPEIDDIEGIPLKFSIMPTEGQETEPVIRMREVERIDKDWDIYIIDDLTGKKVDMRQSLEYEIENVDELYEGRFAVLLEKRGAVSKIKEVEDIYSSGLRKFDVMGRMVDDGYRGIVIGRDGIELSH